ncbi:MAG TPA: HAD-IIB family hydrolase [Candidatus Paceibacterota bacterium]
MKKLEAIAFDLDGTLTVSKGELGHKIADLLAKLLDEYKILIITGGNWKQFQKQFLSHFKCSRDKLDKLTLIADSGGETYRYRNSNWQRIYSNTLSNRDVTKVHKAIKQALGQISWQLPLVHYGERIEDRGAEITFSALGQNAPISEKLAWDPNRRKRMELAEKLRSLLPDFEANVGGSSSVDITRKGINKASALRQYFVDEKMKPGKLLYVGDALFPGGNDSSVVGQGEKTEQVDGPDNTARLITSLLTRGKIVKTKR